MSYYVRKTYPQPGLPEWNMWVHQNYGITHCKVCLALDRRWFKKEKTPKMKHKLCHCVLEDVPYFDVLTKCTSNSAYGKFDPYLFDVHGEYKHGKDKLFKAWGYTVEDTMFLKAEMEKQGLENYVNGNYELGILNDKGQRISIRIEIARKDTGEMVSFLTGWMVYPNGHIQLITPYGGK